ncbi:MAG: proline dehydrogenase family protein [Gemmatimonadetes bacterium]|nr:proline dehydrogenase family protein [Gemmatimonadota bacterium]
MGVARSVLLRASRSRWLAAQLRHRAFFRRAVKRFLPGEDLEAALAAAGDLAAAGIGSILTELGEQVTSRAEAEAVRHHYHEVLDRVNDRRLPARISIKLTHLGLDLDPETCLASLRSLAAHATETANVVWIDMEESRYVDRTLDIFRRLRAERDNVGVCLQAYLHRTPADLDTLLPLTPAIRLVKGAYNEPAHLAFPKKADVDAQYFALASRLLEHVPQGARPVFGTHDLGLIARIQARAAALGVAPQTYQFQMLYGIRAAEQRGLAAAGAKIGVLISYGSAWFAWYMRRLAERPANVWFVMRNLL